MAEVLPRKVGIRSHHGCTVVSSYSTHWPCVFPQVGPGRKHERSIALVDWQRDLVEREPRQFLRGLIESDGDRHINSIKGANGRRYDYPRYGFTNRSGDILGLFAWGCSLVGVSYTRTSDRRMAVSRRADVALLDTFIGPKS